MRGNVVADVRERVCRRLRRRRLQLKKSQQKKCVLAAAAAVAPAAHLIASNHEDARLIANFLRAERFAGLLVLRLCAPPPIRPPPRGKLDRLFGDGGRHRTTTYGDDAIEERKKFLLYNQKETNKSITRMSPQPPSLKTSFHCKSVFLRFRLRP